MLLLLSLLSLAVSVPVGALVWLSSLVFVGVDGLALLPLLLPEGMGALAGKLSLLGTIVGGELSLLAGVGAGSLDSLFWLVPL